MAAPQRVTIRPGSAVPLDAILEFTRRTYGPASHQATERFHRWCYQRNPNRSEELGGAIVAVREDGRVVATVNRLLMAWNVEGVIMPIPAIGDLAVDEEERKGGLGLRMVMRSVQGAQHAFVNGSNPNSSPLFRGLKYQELTGAFWGRLVLAPVRAAARHGLYRAFGRSPGDHTLLTPRTPDGFTATADPTDELLLRLAAFLNAAPATIKPHWDVPSLRWRFFDAEGPRHLLLFAGDTTGTITAAMLLSAGPRHGIHLCRPIAWRCADAASFSDLLRTAIRLARSSGMDAMAAFSFDPVEAQVMERSGLKRTATAPATFFHHKRRDDAQRFSSPLIQGAVSDMGLEGFQRGR